MQEEEESDGEEAEEDAKAREPKKKTLRPPGYKRPPPTKKPAPGTEAADEQEPAPKRARRTSSDAAAAAAAAAIPAERTVGVRESTRQKVQEGEDERKAVEASKPRRPSRPVVHRQLTQAELLAEAARTAIENTRSLQYLVAIEEETKRKANIKKGKYVGPMVRLHSAAGVDGEEKTTIEVRNMQAPAYLQAQTAPAPPARPTCVISGKPARYRDPVTGLAYADLAAYKELQARKQQQAAAQVQRQQAQNQYAAQQQQQQQQQMLLQQQAMMQQRQAAYQQQQFFAAQQAAAQMAAAAAAGGAPPNFFPH